MASRAELRALGLSDDAIDARARKGVLLRVERGVYAAGHDSLTQHGRWLAAVLTCGKGAVLSHRSAAALWGLCPPGRPIEVTVASARRSRRGITVHRSTQLPSAELTRRSHIPVTRPARTAIDFAEVTERRPLERAVDEAVRRRLSTEGQLRAAVVRHRGRIGAARVAAVLDEHDLGSTATENDFEELFLAICDEAGFPRPRCQVPLLGYRADFLWPNERLVVETDGRGSHLNVRAFEGDRARDTELGNAGWKVRRFTWRQLTTRRAWVAAKVSEALGAPMPGGPSPLARLTETSIEKS